MCFWPAKSRKDLNFLRCIHVFDMVIKFCADIYEGSWLKLVFYFIVLMGMVASIFKKSFFIFFQVSFGNFVALQCHGNVCIWNPKLI